MNSPSYCHSALEVAVDHPIFFFCGAVLMPWIFSPAGAAAMPHARATSKTIEGDLGLGYLALSNAATACSFGS